MKAEKGRAIKRLVAGAIIGEFGEPARSVSMVTDRVMKDLDYGARSAAATQTDPHQWETWMMRISGYRDDLADPHAPLESMIVWVVECAPPHECAAPEKAYPGLFATWKACSLLVGEKHWRFTHDEMFRHTEISSRLIRLDYDGQVVPALEITRADNPSEVIVVGPRAGVPRAVIAQDRALAHLTAMHLAISGAH